MKAIIPVAGMGSKLRPHTHTHPKSLIPVAGKPILSHIIDNLLKGGISHFHFIIGYLGEQVQDFISKNYQDIQVNFTVQANRQGIAHAIWLARDHFKEEEQIIIALGDTIFEMDLKGFIKSKYSSVGTKKVDDPRSFGVAEIGENGFITKLVEKPGIPKSNIALVGIYKIREINKFIEALDFNIKNNITTKNEHQLTDCLMSMLEGGIKFTHQEVENWFDCGKKDALLYTNALLLKNSRRRTTEHPNAENCIIIDPVNISQTSRIKDSIIGPNVSIGENAIIEYSVLNNCIIGPYAQIYNAVLHNSLIGNDASFRGISHSLNLGDSTEINFEC